MTVRNLTFPELEREALPSPDVRVHVPPELHRDRDHGAERGHLPVYKGQAQGGHKDGKEVGRNIWQERKLCTFST